VIVDCAVYVDGLRIPDELDFEGSLEAARAHRGFVWIGLHEPDHAEFATVADAFSLHPLAVEDAVHPHQRPKLEHFDDTMFVVLKPAQYVDEEEVVEVDQIMVFLGTDFVVSVRHGSSTALTAVRARLDGSPDLLEWGSGSVLYAIADQVVDDYDGVVRGLENDIDQIEEQVFSGPEAAHSQRIFKLKREVLDFRRAVEPLEPALDELRSGARPVDPASTDYFRDVHDHLLRIRERLVGLDALLDSALNANVAQVGMRQNEDMRKISAWVAIIAMPTMIAGIYGMNFEHMPELGWRFGYPAALVAMVVSCVLLYKNFKHRGWL
jgi:magnesium transporter